jgi:hypothetical protein
MSSGAPVETGMPIRYPSVALMCVDSEDGKIFDSDKYRIDSNRPSQIYINNQRPIMFGYMTRLALTEMNIQWDTPNVNSLNNTLTLKLYSATYDVSGNVVTTTVLGYERYTLDPGFYTQGELASFLQTQINAGTIVTANSMTFTVEYGVASKNFAIKQTAVDPSGNPVGLFTLVPGDAPLSLTGLPAKQYDLLYLMGLESSSILKNSAYKEIYGAYAPMIYTPYIDVVSNLLTKNQNVSDGSTSKIYTGSKLARVYFSNEMINNSDNDILDPSGNDIFQNNTIGITPFRFRREFITPKQIQWNNTENVDVVDIQVLDYKGNPVTIEETFVAPQPTIIELQNNTAFQFTIQITEV